MTGRWTGLSLGANQGPRKPTLESAAAMLSRSLRLTGRRLSGLFESDPWGRAEGPSFLNCVIVGRTPLAPREALERCRDAERSAGSAVRKGGGARRLDVDMLFMEGESLSGPELELPHPRMHLRGFVLVPLSQVWSRPVPGLGETPDQLLETLDDGCRVEERAPRPPEGSTRWEDGD